MFSHPLRGVYLLCKSRYVSSGSSADFFLTPTFSKLASGRTLLVRRSAYTRQYRFRAPMMQLAARLLEGLNSLGRGWLYFFYYYYCYRRS